MNPKRGLLIQAPSGTGKSWFLWDYPQKKCKILDADKVLKEHKVFNDTWFWYPTKDKWDQTNKYRNDVWKVLNTKLEEGYHIMYSGNPFILPTDYIVMIPFKKRIQQREERRIRAHKGIQERRIELTQTEEKKYREFAQKYPKKIFKSIEALIKHINC